MSIELYNHKRCITFNLTLTYKRGVLLHAIVADQTCLALNCLKTVLLLAIVADQTCLALNCRTQKKCFVNVNLSHKIDIGNATIHANSPLVSPTLR